MAVPRSVASRTELQIDWSYPMYSTDGNRAGTRSISVEAKRALPLDEVFAYIAGEDPRPILVLRECVTCSGTDDALLTRQSDNEKTMLMSRWFHCIKISPSVLETDHEFNELFPGETPAHLFVARPDGSSRIDLNGAQSRTELWKVMGTLLDSVYSEKPDKALKRLYRVLDGFDAIDQRIVALQSDFEAAVEAGGLSSSKAKKIKKKLTKLHQEFSDLRAEASEVSKLKLRKKKA